MAPSRTYELVDLLLKGGLETYLRNGRSEGLSFDSLALGLNSRSGVSITSETIRVWCHNLGIEPKQVKREAS